MPARTSPARGAPRARLDREWGIATVWAASWIFVCLSIGWLGLLAGAITARQHHLDGSADLVALSAAARLERGGDACALAAEIAAANDVGLISCVIEGDDVLVSVSDDMPLPLGVDGTMVSRARAGP